MKVKEESEKAALNSTFQKLRSWHLVPHHFMANRWGNSGNNDRQFWGAPKSKSLKMLTAVLKLKGACSLEEKL